MTNIKRKWDLMNKDRKANVIREVINYCQAELDLEIGVIAAEDMLDFFLEQIGPDIYNKAIDDSKATMKQGFENLEIDLDVLYRK